MKRCFELNANVHLTDLEWDRGESSLKAGTHESQYSGTFLLDRIWY